VAFAVKSLHKPSISTENLQTKNASLRTDIFCVNFGGDGVWYIQLFNELDE
jgi:hypothetical protein